MLLSLQYLGRLVKWRWEQRWSVCGGQRLTGVSAALDVRDQPPRGSGHGCRHEVAREPTRCVRPYPEPPRRSILRDLGIIVELPPSCSRHHPCVRPHRRLDPTACVPLRTDGQTSSKTASSRICPAGARLMNRSSLRSSSLAAACISATRIRLVAKGMRDPSDLKSSHRDEPGWFGPLRCQPLCPPHENSGSFSVPARQGPLTSPPETDRYNRVVFRTGHTARD